MTDITKKSTLTLIPGAKVDPLKGLDRVRLLEEMDVVEALEVYRRIRRQRRVAANSPLHVVQPE